MRWLSRLAAVAFLLFSLVVFAEPQGFTYRVYLDFGQRHIGFETCEYPAYNDVGVEITFTLLRPPSSATLYLHFYSVDRCAAYYTATVNDFFLADFVNLENVEPCQSKREGEACDTYIPVRVPVHYLRSGVNSLRVVLHRRCRWIWERVWKCGARRFFLYNDSYLELVYRAVNISFQCVPRVCRSARVAYELPTGHVQLVEVPVPSSLLVPEGSPLNFTVVDVITADGTRWVYRGFEQRINGSRVSVVAFFDTYYRVDVSSPVGEVSGGGWYKEGDLAVVSVAQTVLELPNRTRLVFVGWSGSISSESPTLTFRVQSPVSLVANWVREYYVHVGRPASECSGWYREGSDFTCSFPRLIDYGNGTRDALVEVRADSESIRGRLVVRKPTVVEPVYKRMYRLAVMARKRVELSLLGHALTLPLPSQTLGEEWVDAGATARVAAPSIPLFQFEGWSEGGSTPSLSVTIERPLALFAAYRLVVPLEIPLAMLGLLLLVKSVPGLKSIARPRLSRLRWVLERWSVEQAARNVEGFADILETRGCIRAAEALNLLLRHVVGPIRPLEKSFGHLREFEELKREIDEERVFLEMDRSVDKVLDGHKVRRLCDKARSWAVRIRNLHLE